MADALERCRLLGEAAGLFGIVTGEAGGRPALLFNGKPLVIDGGAGVVCLACGFTGAQILLQTGGGAFTHPDPDLERDCGETLIAVETARLGDEELQMHLVQAWREHASDEQRHQLDHRAGERETRQQ